MILTLKREVVTDDYTEGKMYVDGEYYCDTIEDRWRDLSEEKKQFGVTAIPAGVYRIVMTMSARYNRIMPLLLDVPHFRGVRIHAGNTARDSDGCILTGRKLTDGMIHQSREFTNRLYTIIDDAIKKGETVEIEII